MKRITTLLLVFIFCLLSITGQVWAEDSNTSTMVLKENSEIYIINDKEFKFEKPFIKQDTLMSCLSPILKAMNVTLDKSADTKTIVLKYSGSTIVMYVGSKAATVDGRKVEVPQAPVLVNGSIMVPLRFVVENFGGEVSVDSETKEVTVTKETAGDNSIKDFSLLLKKTTKEIVGDSYYNWSMHLPKDVKIYYRSFNGSYNVFEAVDESYNFSLSIYDLETGETFETLVSSELKYASDYTLISQEKLKKNGLDYFKIVYKDDSSTYEDRYFIKGSKVYELYFEIEDTDKYKENYKEISELLDSFIPEFKKDDKAEDLSDVTADGYRIYEDKKLNFSVKVPADWYESAYDDKDNQVTFTEPAKNSSTYSDKFVINMYSLENGFTLDKWNEIELQYVKDELNPELFKVLKTEDVTVNNIKSKKIICSTKLKNKTTYTYNIYFVGKNYKYHLQYSTTKPYDNPIIQNDINRLLGSFSFSEPDPDEVGSFLDPQSIAKSESLRLVDSKGNGFSFEVPAYWSKVTSTDNATEHYSNDDYSMNVIVNSKKGVSEQQYNDLTEKAFKESAATISGFIYNGKQTINDKGVKITKYDIRMDISGFDFNITYYVLNKNGTTYEATFFMQELMSSEKNKKILSDIWKSLKFE